MIMKEQLRIVYFRAKKMSLSEMSPVPEDLQTLK